MAKTNFSSAKGRGLRTGLWTLQVAIATGLSVSLTACGSSSGSAAEASVSTSENSAANALLPSSIKSKGTLTVAMLTNSPPASSFAAGGQQLIGYDPDIAKLLADTLGLKLNIKVVAFDQMIPGIQAGRYDAILADLSPTPERERILDFVDYGKTGDALAVQNGNPLKMTVDSMCGRKIGALIGGYQVTQVLPGLNAKCTKSGKPPIDIKLYPDENAPILALASGRIEGVYEDSPVADYAAKQNPQIEVARDTNFGPVAVGLLKGSQLTRAVQVAMQKILASREYRAILDRWGVSSIAVTEAKVNDNG